MYLVSFYFLTFSAVQQIGRRFLFLLLNFVVISLNGVFFLGWFIEDIKLISEHYRVYCHEIIRNISRTVTFSVCFLFQPLHPILIDIIILISAHVIINWPLTYQIFSLIHNNKRNKTKDVEVKMRSEHLPNGLKRNLDPPQNLNIQKSIAFYL